MSLKKPKESSPANNLQERLLGVWKKCQKKNEKKSWWRVETALITIAIFCGLFSGLLSHFNEVRKDQLNQQTYRQQSVLVAAVSLKSGTVISESSLQTSSMLLKNISKNNLNPSRVSMILGRKLAIDLKAGDPILLTALKGYDRSREIAQKIPPGKRLFSLNISDTTASLGFIAPNDHVDILAHIKLPNRGKTTFTLLQDITLISVGSSTSRSKSRGGGTSIVSFFVNAKDMEMMSFAQSRGTFSLALRNPKDVGKPNTGKGIDINEFLDYDGISNHSGGGDLKVTEKGQALKGKL